MKKILLFSLLVLSLGTLCMQAQPAPQAEDFYQRGQYAQALSAYEQELKHYPNNPFLYYNIGNCYFKMGSTGLAVANYYRAFLLNPRDGEIRHNLALAMSASAESLVPQGVPESLHKVVFWLSLTELKGLFTICGLFFGLMAGIWLLTRKAGTFTLILGVLLLVVGSWFFARHSWQSKPLAVIAAIQAELRSGPGENFPASATVTQGHLVEIVDQKGPWQQVVLRKEGIKGWIDNTALERI